MRFSSLAVWIYIALPLSFVQENFAFIHPSLLLRQNNNKIPSSWTLHHEPLFEKDSLQLKHSMAIVTLLMGRPGADIEADTTTTVTTTTTTAATSTTTATRKVNEIDFCIAPADVSLSRSKEASLTRALNDASNRAVRRILLARAWPSAEALNQSLQQVLSSSRSKENEEEEENNDTDKENAYDVQQTDILRLVLQRQERRRQQQEQQQQDASPPRPRSRSDQEYVADQIKSFREKYSDLPGYEFAEAYLECLLSLATKGIESDRFNEVMESGVYAESYKRVLNVLSSAGAVFEYLDNENNKDESTSSEPKRRKIADKLQDQNICLSVVDKITMQQEQKQQKSSLSNNDDEGEENNNDADEDEKVLLRFQQQPDVELSQQDLGGILLSAKEPSMTRQLNVLSNIVKRALLFGGEQELLVLSETLQADIPGFIQQWYPTTTTTTEKVSDNDNDDHDKTDSPTMTTTTTTILEWKDPRYETRPGVQYLNCLIQLLQTCRRNGVTTDLDPPLDLPSSFVTAYRRLTGTLVEMSSGYVKPNSTVIAKTMPLPQTAQQELGRFAVWESTFRKRNNQQQQQDQQNDVDSLYPSDLEGTWQVRDEVGGKEIGTSTVSFQRGGKVMLTTPGTTLLGLEWRLDPGPTHLDTCTFQVLAEDGNVLQYRGFLDRGARLEARFSKRPLVIRGSVQLAEMRNGNKGAASSSLLLPINYKTGTTKFVMTKQA